MAKPSILLINPKVDDHSQSRVINRLINISFPTGLGFIYSYLHSHGHTNIHIVDEQIHPFTDETLRETIHHLSSPKMVGISVLTINSGRAYDLARTIKRIDPSVFIVVGGIHPTVMPEEPFVHAPIDVVVRGEGEETFRELADTVFEQKDYSHLLGISHKQHGRIVHNPNRPLISNLDDIPSFPYHLFVKDMIHYPNFTSVFSSRGCPYRCIFCSARSITGVSYRTNSVERIIHDCRTLIETYHQTSISFMDDNMAVNAKHFNAVCDALIREGFHQKASYNCSMRGDNASDDVLKHAKEAHFNIIYFGLETGNERLMKIINKGETLEQVVDAIRRTESMGISPGATVIFGLPSETKTERRDILRFVKTLPLHSVRFSLLAPYPGTPVYQQEIESGRIHIKGQWENFGAQYMWQGDDIPYVPEGNHRLDLIFDTMWANLSFYFSWRGFKIVFTQQVIGSNVINVSKKTWRTYIDMIRLALYLGTRFLSVATRRFFA